MAVGWPFKCEWFDRARAVGHRGSYMHNLAVVAIAGGRCAALFLRSGDRRRRDDVLPDISGCVEVLRRIVLVFLVVPASVLHGVGRYLERDMASGIKRGRGDRQPYLGRRSRDVRAPMKGTACLARRGCSPFSPRHILTDRGVA